MVSSCRFLHIQQTSASELPKKKALRRNQKKKADVISREYSRAKDRSIEFYRSSVFRAKFLDQGIRDDYLLMAADDSAFDENLFKEIEGKKGKTNFTPKVLMAAQTTQEKICT